MTDMHRWSAPPASIRLPDNEIHVWLASIIVDQPARAAFEQLLSSDECERAARFYFERDRHRYMFTHGLLRTLLGRYLNADPCELRFQTNEYGKPSLAGLPDTQPLYFNLSHSHELVAFAFTRAAAVGIDIEFMSGNIDYVALAKHSFSTSERDILRALPPSEQQGAFYRCWSRKEAYIKARSMGLYIPLDQFDVSLKTGEPAALLCSREDGVEAAHWSLYDLPPIPGYAAALAIKNGAWQTRFWQWHT